MVIGEGWCSIWTSVDLPVIIPRAFLRQISGFNAALVACVFPSGVALASHERAAHKKRSETRLFALTSKCECCKTDFHTRLRLIEHLGNTRAATCLQWCRENVVPLSTQQLKVLDAETKELRSNASKSGHAHALIDMPAKRSKPILQV